MCGILGVINGEKHRVNGARIEQFLLSGCITGVLRGMDSTGIYQVQKNKNVRIWKKPVDGGTFIQLKNTQALFRSAEDASATILHHRAATHGTVSQENCHPFEHDSETNYIVGVHNGGYAGFARREDGITFEVDSDWLYYQILKHGPAKALGALPDTAAYALVWYDQEKDKHYMASNGQRAISFGFVKGKNLMLLASEHSHLYWLASRNDIEFEETLWTPKKGFIYEFSTDNLRDYKVMALEAPPKVVPTYKPGRRYNSKTNTWSDIETVGPTSPLLLGPVDRVERSGGALISRSTAEAHVSVAYTDVVIHDQGVKRLAPYEFWPMEGKDSEKMPSVPCLIFGVCKTGSEPEDICDAVMQVWTPSAYDNLRNCDYAICTVAGVRKETAKLDAKISEQLIMSDPKEYRFHREEKKEEAAPVVEEKADKFFRGPRGKNLTEEQFCGMVESGCISCSAPITVLDSEFLSWVNGGTDPCCAECTEKLAKGEDMRKAV